MGGLLPGVDVESRWPIITNTCGLAEFAHQHPQLSNTATPKRKARRYKNEILRHKEYLEGKKSLLREAIQMGPVVEKRTHEDQTKLSNLMKTTVTESQGYQNQDSIKSEGKMLDNEEMQVLKKLLGMY